MWTEIETSTYQDHVIKHVLGATVLAWVTRGDAAHFLLDVGLLWTIYVNAEMNLMAQSVAIQDLEGDDFTPAEITDLTADADNLFSHGPQAHDLKLFMASPVECLITSVRVFADDEQRRVLIAGEVESLELEMSRADSTFALAVHTSVGHQLPAAPDLTVR